MTYSCIDLACAAEGRCRRFARDVKCTPAQAAREERSDAVAWLRYAAGRASDPAEREHLSYAAYVLDQGAHFGASRRKP